jgi:hypothetical protein
MNRNRWKNLLGVILLAGFGTLAAQPARAGLMPAAPSGIDGGYTIVPGAFSGPLPISFMLVGGSVTGPVELAGDPVNDFTMSIDSMGVILSSPLSITVDHVIGSATWDLVTDLKLSKMTGGGMTTSILKSDLSLTTNDTGIDLSALQAALLTIKLDNVDLDPQWPVNDSFPVEVTFSITPRGPAAPVPEPASVLLWAVLGGAAWVWRRGYALPGK